MFLLLLSLLVSSSASYYTDIISSLFLLFPLAFLDFLFCLSGSFFSSSHFFSFNSNSSLSCSIFLFLSYLPVFRLDFVIRSSFLDFLCFVYLSTFFASLEGYFFTRSPFPYFVFFLPGVSPVYLGCTIGFYCLLSFSHSSR